MGELRKSAENSKGAHPAIGSACEEVAAGGSGGVGSELAIRQAKVSC